MARHSPHGEAACAESSAEQRNSGPTEGSIHACGCDGTDCAANGIEDHVAADESALRVRIGGEEQALIGDVDRLHGKVQMFFPKFGLARGKAALVKFSETLTSELEGIEHDIDGFSYDVESALRLRLI